MKEQFQVVLIYIIAVVIVFIMAATLTTIFGGIFYALLGI